MTGEVVRELEIRNRLGLHARAAAAFTRVAGRYRAEVTVELDGAAVDGKSLLGLLTLGASRGKRIRLLARGEMAEQAVAALAALVEGRFGERE
ncbi:MAG: HPr family phosphocarrier protein [candidate division NC10 bacterium]|nr:HPr family phosphocarrier protein [candidate division NC10 bacterium]MBI4391958.1 HPr family phosphocarrier protein [candidate division NC10 bacterium]